MCRLHVNLTDPLFYALARQCRDKRIAVRCELNNIVQGWDRILPPDREQKGAITLGIRAGADCRGIRIIYRRIVAEMVVNWRPCSGSECKAALESASEVERIKRPEHYFELEDNGIS